MTTTKSKPICPDSRASWYDGTRLCNLNDKICLLESGNTCKIYDDWLREVEQ